MVVVGGVVCVPPHKDLSRLMVHWLEWAAVAPSRRKALRRKAGGQLMQPNIM